MAAAAPPLRRVAVVTGTARPHGIGRAVARRFIRQGYNVLGVDKLRLQDPETGGCSLFCTAITALA